MPADVFIGGAPGYAPALGQVIDRLVSGHARRPLRGRPCAHSTREACDTCGQRHPAISTTLGTSPLGLGIPVAHTARERAARVRSASPAAPPPSDAERGAQVTSRTPTLAPPRVAYSSRRGVPRDDVTLGGKRGKTGPRKNAEKRKNRWYLWWGGSGSNRRRPDYESGALTS